MKDEMMDAIEITSMSYLMDLCAQAARETLYCTICYLQARTRATRVAAPAPDFELLREEYERRVTRLSADYAQLIELLFPYPIAVVAVPAIQELIEFTDHHTRFLMEPDAAVTAPLSWWPKGLGPGRYTIRMAIEERTALLQSEIEEITKEEEAAA